MKVNELTQVYKTYCISCLYNAATEKWDWRVELSCLVPKHIFSGSEKHRIDAVKRARERIDLFLSSTNTLGEEGTAK